MKHLLFIALTLINGFVFGYGFRTQARDREKLLFKQFMHMYNKSYSRSEEGKRFSIFMENVKYARMLQANAAGSVRFGITIFSDLTIEEFNAKFTNTRYLPVPPGNGETYNGPMLSLPERFDWRDKGAVTRVKYQGHCGSCYAFAVAGNIEAQWFLKNGTLRSLSAQQIVDCDEKDLGCKGGIPTDTYSEVIRMGGLMRDLDYRYRFHRFGCRLDNSKIRAKIDDYTRILKDENVIAHWIVENGPVAATMDSQMLQFYQSGIFSPSAAICATFAWNHVVLIVGYGVERGIPYWIVKNSWGAHWGEQGYFRIYRGNGTCGINRFVTTSIIY